MSDNQQAPEVEETPQDERPLNEIEFRELVNFITSNQSPDQPHYSHGQFVAILSSYGTAYSLPAMYRYLQWSIENSQSAGQIMATIIHDINGHQNGERFFSPRSESY